VEPPPPDRRTVWAWSLYDFGNSSFAVLFPSLFSVYYGERLVAPSLGKASVDLYWGITIASSMLLVAFLAPFVGGIADHTGGRKRLLGIFTALGIGAVLALLGVGPGGAGMIVVASILAGLANFAFEGALVFYNAYLPLIAPPSHRGRVSALGFAVGYFGSLVALAIAYPLVQSDVWGWIWLAIALQWLLFALPAFVRLPADRRTGMGVRQAAGLGLKQTRRTLAEIWGMPNLRRFLIAFFIYMDGVITVVYFASRYAKNTLAFSTTEVIGMLAIVQVAALVGSMLMAMPTDRMGPRWVVRVTLLWWVGVAVCAFLAHSVTFFLVVAGLAGLGLGAIQAASRVFMSRLIPAGRESEFFGFYALCGKTGSILGPLTFGVVTALSGGNQRPAVLAVAAFYFLGLVLLRNVNDRPVA
jgi:UMF1 family MFS transporter